MTEEQPSDLTAECGHHCGVLTSGGRVRHVGHCDCVECHAGDVGRLGGVTVG